jgi:hypothetical protein
MKQHDRDRYDDTPDHDLLMLRNKERKRDKRERLFLWLFIGIVAGISLVAICSIFKQLYGRSLF